MAAHHGRPAGDVDEVAPASEIALTPTASPNSAIPIGRPIGDQRPEGQQQDDDRGDQADQLADAGRGLLEGEEQVAAHLDPQRRRRPRTVVDGRLEAVQVGRRQLLDHRGTAPGSGRPGRRPNRSGRRGSRRPAASAPRGRSCRARAAGAATAAWTSASAAPAPAESRKVCRRVARRDDDLGREARGRRRRPAASSSAAALRVEPRHLEGVLELADRRPRPPTTTTTETTTQARSRPRGDGRPSDPAVQELRHRGSSSDRAASAGSAAAASTVARAGGRRHRRRGRMPVLPDRPGRVSYFRPVAGGPRIPRLGRDRPRPRSVLARAPRRRRPAAGVARLGCWSARSWPTALLEGIAPRRRRLAAAGDRCSLAASLAPSLLWRRTHPLAWSRSPSAAACSSVNVAADRATTGDLGLYTMIYLLVLPYALFRWGIGAGGRARAGARDRPGRLRSTASLRDWTGGRRRRRERRPADVLGGARRGRALPAPTYRRRASATRSAAEERVELARELHDTVAHHVSAIAVQAQAGRRRRRAPTRGGRRGAGGRSRRRRRGRSPRCGRWCGRCATGTPADLRPAARRRRPASGWRAPHATRHRSTVELAGDLDGLRAAVDAAVYRLAQESVTNALRHARQRHPHRRSVVERAGRRRG